MIYLSPKMFKSAVRAGHYDASSMRVAKAALGVPDILPDRCAKFTCSTDAVDRDNDRINQKGWKLKNFKSNPVALWGHQSSAPPIGRVIEIGVEGGALKAVVEFVPADNPLVGAQAEGIYQMCKGGFISAVSVGFSPIEWDLSEDEARSGKNYGVDFHSCELFELSLCSIPANPEALIEPIPAKRGDDAAITARQLNTGANGRRLRIAQFYETIGVKP